MKWQVNGVTRWTRDHQKNFPAHTSFVQYLLSQVMTQTARTNTYVRPRIRIRTNVSTASFYLDGIISTKEHHHQCQPMAAIIMAVMLAWPFDLQSRWAISTPKRVYYNPARIPLFMNRGPRGPWFGGDRRPPPHRGIHPPVHHRHQTNTRVANYYPFSFSLHNVDLSHGASTIVQH